MQAAAQQGLGLVAAAGGQDFHLHAEPLAQLLDGHIIEEGVLLLPQHHGRHAQRAAGQPALALSDDVGRRDEARHADVAAEEVVFDGMHFYFYHGVLAVELVHHLGDEGRGHGAGDDIHLFGAIDAVGLFQLGQKFLPEEAHHAHAVFQLVVVLIKLRLRDGAAGLEVPLIAGVDDALAVAALALVAELFHDVDDGGAGLSVVGRLLEEVLAVIRHAAGDCRHALHHRGQLQQVGEGAAELVAVVDAPAEHQLAVDGDAALHQAGQVLQHLAAPFIRQHPHAELGIGGVDRDVDGRDMHLDDAVDLVVLHVGHGDIVAEQKGQALVVVLEVEALTHSRGQLVDEAEHAVVGAGVLLVAQIGGEVAAEGAALFPLDVPLPDAVRHSRFEVEALAVGIKIIVQRVVQLVAVHAQQLVAASEAEGFCLAARVHAVDPDGHAFTSQFRFQDKARRGRHCALPFCT